MRLAYGPCAVISVEGCSVAKSGGEIVVSRAGEAYDARARGLNPKFRIKRA